MCKSRVRVVVWGLAGEEGETVEVVAGTGELVYRLKVRLARRLGIPARRQHLLRGHQELADWQTLDSYALRDGTALRLVVALPIVHCTRTHTHTHLHNTNTHTTTEDSDTEQEQEQEQDQDMPHHHRRHHGDTWIQDKYIQLGLDRDDKQFPTLAPRSDIPRFPGIPQTKEECTTKCKMMDVQYKMRELAIRRYEKSTDRSVNEYFEDDVSDAKNHQKNPRKRLPSLKFELGPPGEGTSNGSRDSPKPSSNRLGLETAKSVLPSIDPKKSDDPEGESKKSSDRLRCLMCRARLSIATVHKCECGEVFCPPHRYSEAHGCKHDYGDEWQNQLRKANPPAVILPKIPKI